MLAATAATMIYLDPSQPDNDQWHLTWVILAAYALYSTILYILAIRRNLFLASFGRWAHWIDLAWFTVLISMSSGTNRIFFFGFLFATLTASFRRGFSTGLTVAIVSTLSITVVGYASETASPGFDNYGFNVYRFLLRPIYMLVLGYMMAHWGGREITLKRRLALLKDLTLSNPRFGVDRTINSMIERLRRFYDADLGLLVMSDLRTGEYLLYRSEGRGSQTAAHPERIATQFARGLLALPPEVAVCYNRQQFRWWPFWKPYYAFDVLRGERVSEGHEASSTLANTIDATSLISVPVFRQEQIIGRMYFGMQRWQLFDSSDVEFLLQVLEHVSPIIENIRLVDRLASDAAEQERQRIARDIHDSVIQPYIGFQIGLSGLRRKLPMGEIDLNAEIERLLEMTTVGIADLRSYVGGLKSSGEQEVSLLPAMQRFARRFSEATGIGVDIDAPQEIQLNDILAAEVFQMVAEGLSNIRRHTEATRAIIRVTCDQEKLTLQIENDGNAASSFKPFTPRSLTERAVSLNGQARVDKRSDGGTIVHIEVPL